jgi:hypothetical protein
MFTCFVNRFCKHCLLLFVCVLFFCHPCLSSSSLSLLVIPAKAGIQKTPNPNSLPLASAIEPLLLALDARLRGHDGGMALAIAFLCLSCRLCAFAGMTGEWPSSFVLCSYLWVILAKRRSSVLDARLTLCCKHPFSLVAL